MKKKLRVLCVQWITFLLMLIGVLIISDISVEAATESQNNIVARANYMWNSTWVCQKQIAGWKGRTLFCAEQKYRLPYAQPISKGGYIGYAITVEDFKKVAADVNSVFYTSQSANGSAISTFYGNDCSAFVSYCWGIKRNTTATIASVSTYVGIPNVNNNTYNLQIGDALNSTSAGHVVLVTGLTYNGSGAITGIEITEQTPPQLKRTNYTPTSLASKYSNAYKIYRYKGVVPPPPEPIIIPDDTVEISNVKTNEKNENGISVSFTTTGKKSKAVAVDIVTNETWSSEWAYGNSVTVNFHRQSISSKPKTIKLLLYSYAEEDINSNVGETVHAVSDGGYQVVVFDETFAEISNVNISDINNSYIKLTFNTIGKKSKAVAVDVSTNETWSSDWVYGSNVSIEFQRHYLNNNPRTIQLLLYSYLDEDISSNKGEAVHRVSFGGNQIVVFPALEFKSYVDVIPNVVVPDKDNLISGWAATDPSNPLNSIEVVLNETQSYICKFTSRDDLLQVFPEYQPTGFEVNLQPEWMQEGSNRVQIFGNTQNGNRNLIYDTTIQREWLAFQSYVDVIPSTLTPTQSNIVSGWIATDEKEIINNVELVINETQGYVCEYTSRDDLLVVYPYHVPKGFEIKLQPEWMQEGSNRVQLFGNAQNGRRYLIYDTTIEVQWLKLQSCIDVKPDSITPNKDNTLNGWVITDPSETVNSIELVVNETQSYICEFTGRDDLLVVFPDYVPKGFEIKIRPDWLQQGNNQVQLFVNTSNGRKCKIYDETLERNWLEVQSCIDTKPGNIISEQDNMFCGWVITDPGDSVKKITLFVNEIQSYDCEFTGRDDLLVVYPDYLPIGFKINIQPEWLEVENNKLQLIAYTNAGYDYLIYEADNVGKEEITTEPITTELVTTEPITTETITTEPVTTEPVTTKPVTTEPVTTEPITTEPVSKEETTKQETTTEEETTEPESTSEEEKTTELESTTEEETTELESISEEETEPESTSEEEKTTEPESTTEEETTELESTSEEETEPESTTEDEETTETEQETTEPEEEKIKIASSNVKIASSKHTYNGYEKKLLITVKVGNKNLLNGVDYVVAYKNNINPGTATVTINGIGAYTGTITKTFRIALAKVASLKQSTNYASTKVTMNWNKVKGATGYVIYRANTKNGSYKYLKSVTTNTLTLQGLKAGSKYYYKVRAYKTVNSKIIYGDYSDAKSMFTKTAAPKINVVLKTRTAKISWAKVTGAQGYEIYMSTSKSGTYKKLKAVGSTTLSSSKTGLVKGKKYYFKVRSYTKTGTGAKVYSGYSNVKAVSVK